jgi:carboxymethylenebutenolidase
MQGAQDHGLAGVAGFYGSLVRDGGHWTLDRAPEISVPVLGLFAGDDAHITPEQIAEFASRLSVPHEIQTYAGAPHSFFDRRQAEYAEQSEDAWNRVLDFISQRQVEAQPLAAGL